MKRTEEGASLVGLIVAIVLVVLIGGGAFYGYQSIDRDKSGTNKDLGTKTRVDSSLVGNTLRLDMSGAKAARTEAGGQRIDIARIDGSCVSWKIVPDGTGSKQLMRASNIDTSAVAEQGAIVTQGIAAGQFSSTSSSVSVHLSYQSSPDFDDQVNFQNGQDGGGCW